MSPEIAAELALHFEEGRVYDRAIAHLMRAARIASRRYAHRDAIEILEHARSLLANVADPPRSALELQMLDQIGRAHYARGDLQHSAEVYRSLAIRAAAAGLLDSQTDAMSRLPHTSETVPFFLQAIDLTPDLTTPYVSLSRIYSNLGDTSRARLYATLAYERRARADAREQFSIEYQYHFDVTGDQERAIAILETWDRSQPADYRPVNALALIHVFLGDHARAIDEGREAVTRNPSHGYPYSNLALAYRCAGRFQEARQTAEQAVALNVETLLTRRLLYHLALMSGDAAAAAAHVKWARDKPREFDMIAAQAQVAAWSGRVGEARALYADAARMAEQRDLADVAATHLASTTWMDLAYGSDAEAARAARRVVDREPSYDPLLRAAIALAATGAGDRATAIASDLAAANPHHTLIHRILLPLLHAAVAVGENDPARAIAGLEAVRPVELGLIASLAPLYLRARAHLMQDASRQAADEFERILNHRGVDPFSPFHAMAPLGLARARARLGDTDGSGEPYESFLAAWRDADPDVPVLRSAREEYSRLRRS